MSHQCLMEQHIQEIAQSNCEFIILSQIIYIIFRLLRLLINVSLKHIPSRVRIQAKQPPSLLLPHHISIHILPKTPSLRRHLLGVLRSLFFFFLLSIRSESWCFTSLSRATYLCYLNWFLVTCGQHFLLLLFLKLFFFFKNSTADFSSLIINRS